jgi:hypothetical protein
MTSFNSTSMPGSNPSLLMIPPLIRSIAAILLLLLAAPRLSPADDSGPSPTEIRLREALRDTMLQLRDAQNQIVTLQNTQAQSDKDNTDLKAKVDAQSSQIKSLTDQAADDKAASDKAIADLKSQVTDLTGENGRLNDALKQWKGAYNQVSQLATATEAERAKLAIQSATLQRLVDDRENKNVALYKVGSEILTRYEQFSLGDAIGAKEPFVGISRVKLENLVQDYKNKLLDQAITSSPPAPSAPVPLAKPAGIKPAKLTEASSL